MLDRIIRSSLPLILAIAGVGAIGAPTAPAAARSDAPRTPLIWQSRALWRHGLKKSSGTLALNAAGVEFKARTGPVLHWAFVEIQTVTLTPHRLILTGYENRKWHVHGERSFRFDLESRLPPLVAVQLARRVGKPVENGDPDPGAAAFTTLDARHRTRGGGTNGALRFRTGGIDYVTANGRGARSWRWSDIQTIENPDPYHFRVTAYREIFEFELKQPMSRELFDRLWNYLYGRRLQLGIQDRPSENKRGPAQIGMDDER